LVVSFPHFYLGDQSLFENIEGLEPNQTIHESFVDVHPKTGISTENSIKFQVNLLLKKEVFNDQLESNVVLPLYWIDISTGSGKMKKAV
jgi:hypothetical protein